jgi:hypothetical protein
VPPGRTAEATQALRQDSAVQEILKRVLDEARYAAVLARLR